MQKQLCGLLHPVAQFAILFAAVLSTTTAHAQTTYVWNDTTTSWTTTSAWTPAGPADWSDVAHVTDSLASFGNQATILNQPNLATASNVTLRGISIDDSGAAWNISGSIPLNIGGDGVTVTGAGTKTTTLSASTNLLFPQTWTIGAGMTVAATNSFSGSVAFTKAGPGALALSNNSNDYSGAITISGGTLSVSSIGNGGTNSALGAGGAAASNLKFAGSGATLNYTGAGDSTDRSFTISETGAKIIANSDGPLNFTSTANLAYSGSGARTLTLDGTNYGLNTIAAPIADGPGGPTSIKKSGDGTWVLSGTATYTGGTSVTGGFLVLRGDRSAATGAVRTEDATVRIANGTVLGGDLILGHGGSLARADQGGTAATDTNAPDLFGDSPGHVTILGNMTIDHSGIVQFELQGTSPGTEYDRVDVGQNLTIGSANLDLEVSGFTPLDGESFFILNNMGANPISGQFGNALEGATITAGGYLFTITYFADADTLSLTGGNDVALTEIGVVPEPATNLLALSAAALLAARFSRRKAT